jgi:diguanylate cyclase (GGDEF)-like protein/PAS domain S-box-containing protein
VVLLVLVAVAQQGINYLQAQVFDGVRTFVRAEGLWAKAQKDAVFYLIRYTDTRDESDYGAYLNSVQVSAGDQAARLALLQDPPDRDAARQGFIQGANHPDDVDAMIWFFLNFQRVSYLQEAIAVWEQGDAKMAELAGVAEQLRELVHAGAPSTDMAAPLLRLERLNHELTQLENRFSLVLGEGARWVRTTLWTLSVGLLLLMGGAALLVSRQIVRGIVRDEQRLLMSESRFRSLKDSDTIGIVSWRADGQVDEANDAFLHMLGLTRQDLREGRFNWRDRTPASAATADAHALAQLLSEGRCDPYEKTILHADGHEVPIYLGSALLEGSLDSGISYVMDLTERKQSEEVLRLSSTVLSASNDGILITDAQRKPLMMNDALRRMLGYPLPEHRSQTGQTAGHAPGNANTRLSLQLLADPPQDPACVRMWAELKERDHWQGDLMEPTRDGPLLPVRISISAVRNELGQRTHFVAILSDISERLAREEQLSQMAHHDNLTGAGNRVLLGLRLEAALLNAAASQSRMAVLMFDLNGFKPVNDHYGHLVGDKLLQIVARRLSNCVRQTDTVCRVGGDEFVILIDTLDSTEALHTLRDKTVAAIRAPCHIDGHDMAVGVAVGMAVFPDDATDGHGLLQHADTAMYRMKRLEGSR